MDNALTRIPIKVEPAGGGNGLHWWRRATQAGFIVLLLIIPISGLFRIDPIVGAFVILDRQIWWADFFLVFGFWVLLASALVAVYSFVGTAFCGWACPQNTLSEWANSFTRKMLGKRAEVNIDGQKMQVASSKNKVLNWLVLGAAMIAVSMFFALIPLFYFYPPEVVWSFATFRDDERLAASLHYIYLIFVLVILIDVAVIRHFWCRFMCVYKVWQHGFRTRQTLHIHYDEARKDECAKCNYCVTACFLDLDPRQTDVYDSCINCGECVVACNKKQARKGQPGLLRLVTGEQRVAGPQPASAVLGGLSTRLRWTLLFSLIGVALFGYGLMNYNYYHLAVYRSDEAHGAQIHDYRVSVSNKVYQAAELRVSVEGIPEEAFVLSDSVVRFDSVGRADLRLHVRPGLPPGLHALLVRVEAADGWQGSYRAQHFVGKGES